MQYPKQADNYDVDIFNANFRELAGNVISLDTGKFDKTEAQVLFKDVAFNSGNGVITFTLYDGSVKTIDTLLEKLAVNFDFDPQTQRLIITLDDGEVKYIDLSALITQYEFLDSDTVAFTMDGAGKISAKIREGSIGEKHLCPNYLANIKTEAAKAEAGAAAAAESKQAAADSEAVAVASAATATQKAEQAGKAAADAEANALVTQTQAAASEDAAIQSKSYAVGGTGSREGEDTDNAKAYAKKAKESADRAEGIVSGNFIPVSEKGAAGGVASLDGSGKVPKAQLPDDIGNVTGIKGNAESAYRTGNVNLTPTNVGALPDTTLYAGSDSVGGAANNLKYFKNTSTENVGLDTTTENNIGYVYGTDGIFGISDGALYKQVYSSSWAHEIYGDYRTGQIAVRGKNNGTWQAWRKLLDERNYTLLARAFGPQIHYGTKSLNSGWYKVKIKNKTHWMMSCTVFLYQNYTASEILISGYCYADNNWYSPKAKLVASTDLSEIVVHFGYDSDGLLWFAVPAGQYTGLTVCNINNGYEQIEDWTSIITIENQTSLTGTIQATATATDAVGNAAKVGGLAPQGTTGANTIVTRDANGYTYLYYINSNTSNNENPPVSQVIVTNGSDHYYRKASLAHLKAQMGLANVNNTADANKNVATANQINGVYTGGGGAQPPSYVISGKTRFNMMNNFKGLTNPAGAYMDTILMDNYTGGDVPYVTGIGVTKNNGNPRMFIANGAKGNGSSWAHQVEAITTGNISSQSVNYATSAGSATKATQDGNGSVISSTYAKLNANVTFNQIYVPLWRYDGENAFIQLGSGSIFLKNLGTVYVWANNGFHIRDSAGSAYKAAYASAFSVQSSRKYKKNIEDMTEQHALNILKYRVVTFGYINEDEPDNCEGVIAEEVMEINPYPVVLNENKEADGVDYSKFVPELIKMVQIQQKEINELREEIKDLKGMFSSLHKNMG
nr:tail fiber domain-containing protein [uncultured Acetatifactor sp.]